MTKQGFNRLARVLLTALRSRVVGAMIARGDLAECGFKRTAEVQEEILWLCEAAHVPAIWATQVLDSLARTGMPTRAEITDAAMAERAECVMPNQGPYAAEAVRMLSGLARPTSWAAAKPRADARGRVVHRDGQVCSVGSKLAAPATSRPPRARLGNGANFTAVTTAPPHPHRSRCVAARR